MINNLKQLVQENVQKTIIQNSDIPDDKNEAAIEAASGSIFETLKDQVASGNIGNLIEAFKGASGGQDNTIVQKASSVFVEKLSTLGISPDTANSIASSVIPGILNKFINKAKDPNDDSFNLTDIITKISGPDGKFQLSDLTNLLGDSGKENNDLGGVFTKIKGLFK